MPTTRMLTGLQAYTTIAQLLLDPLSTSRDIAHRYGNFTGISLSALKKRPPTFHVVGSIYAEGILKNYDTFRNGGIIVKGYRNSTHNHLRQGYFSANGAEYEHYIKLFGPLFRKKLVEEVYPVIAEIVTDQMDRWPTGEVINIIPRVNTLMKHLASQGMFRDPDIIRGIRAADMVEQHGRLSGASIAGLIAARYGRPPFSRLHRQAKATYDAIIEWGKTRDGLEPRSDVLSTIANAPDEFGRPASADRIAGYGWTMLGASYDTSTSILTWLLVFISTHPEVARKLHEEVRDYQRISPSDISTIMNLPYLDGVIKEALRLVPPAPIQRRKTHADAELVGHPIPAGSQILISAWMTNRDEDLYPDPDQFVPERWSGLSRSPYQWLTFSAGPRRCLGIWFALAFLKTIIASVIARWRPEIPDGSKVSMKVAVTVRPGREVPIILNKPDGNYRASRLTGNVHKYLRISELHRG
ncbi:MAG: cytochrome P450 [Mesorhizobium sp.]|nr:cytochrome P450 [Mesorhizobium sp.]MCO5162294.1 cytochrome P450 [Mesorhizobium sp.]